MKCCVNILCAICGSHERAAAFLGYTDRHYRVIRRKIETGKTVPIRFENLLRAKTRELQLAEAEHACR
jgi:hypothetical protein